MTLPHPLGNLATQYPELFRVAAKRHRAPPYDHVYFGALDAEWFRQYARNVLLSYQIAACSPSGFGNNTIHFVKEGERPDLEVIIDKLIRSVNGGAIPEHHHRRRTLVCLACHNTTAEYSILNDRDKPHIFEAISLVRKSPVTLTKTIDLELPDYSLVDVRLYDTMLLAPATHRSLKKLSSLLGTEAEMKESISQFHLEHMDIFLRDDPEGFVRYALKDTEATLKLFCLLQQSLNELAYQGKVRKLFVTLASAAMNSFIRENRWHKGYLKTLQSPDLTDALRLVRRAYFGGRNEGLLRGRTSTFSATRDKTWVDIDLSGCYPTVMSRIPRLNLAAPFDIRQTSYRLDDDSVSDLVRDNVSPEAISMARAALSVSRWEYEDVLRRLPSSVATRIRERSLVFDNTLIYRWYADWQRAKNTPNAELETVILPGFARVRFHFREKPPLFPCLHVHHPRFGLVYTLRDETVATHMEIMLARDAGALVDAVWSLEFPVARDENGEPVLYMHQYLARLAARRKQHKDAYDLHQSSIDSVFEKLLKEFMNSLYGKFGQGVNPRNVCDATTFAMNRLEPSRITDPVVAALTTGTARAVLSSILLGIEQFNSEKTPEGQIAVASCTTDGCLVGLPSREGYSVLEKYYRVSEVTRGTA